MGNGMCLALPMKIIDRISSEKAVVESDGMNMEISLMLTMDADVGDYVLVHTGFAIEIMDASEAEKTISALSDLSGVLQDLHKPGYPDQ